MNPQTKTVGLFCDKRQTQGCDYTHTKRLAAKDLAHAIPNRCGVDLRMSNGRSVVCGGCASRCHNTTKTGQFEEQNTQIKKMRRMTQALDAKDANTAKMARLRHACTDYRGDIPSQFPNPVVPSLGCLCGARLSSRLWCFHSSCGDCYTQEAHLHDGTRSLFKCRPLQTTDWHGILYFTAFE